MTARRGLPSRHVVRTAISLVLLFQAALAEDWNENPCPTESDAFVECMATTGQAECDEDFCNSLEYSYEYDNPIETLDDLITPSAFCGLWHDRLCPSKICCPPCALYITAYHECVQENAGATDCDLDCGVADEPFDMLPPLVDEEDLIDEELKEEEAAMEKELEEELAAEEDILWNEEFDEFEQDPCPAESEAFLACMATTGQAECDEDYCDSIQYSYAEINGDSALANLETFDDLLDPSAFCGIWHDRLCPLQLCCPPCSEFITAYHNCIQANADISDCELDCGGDDDKETAVVVTPTEAPVGVPVEVPVEVPSEETGATAASGSLGVRPSAGVLAVSLLVGHCLL